MKLLSNPMMLRMAFALFVSAFTCLAAIVLLRRLRKAFMQPASLDESRPQEESLPLQTYHAVIQELKQQKHEVQSAQQAERRRTKTSETISAAVLSHLSSGVMFVTPNGLVRQANAASKSILGFASPVGMSVHQIFRDAMVISDRGSQQELAALVEASLRGDVPTQALQAQYVTPSGDRCDLEIQLTFVSAPSGDAVGVACLINDKTEIARLQRQQELRREISSEMALTLRTSLATISGYARQLAAGREPQQAQHLAANIISEAAQLDRTLGGFLAGAKASARAVGA